MTYKIGIIGAGNVGGTLGRVWASRGHDVLFGVRDPGSAEPLGRMGTIAEAFAHGDILALATPWGATHDVLASAGDLSGKILFDCTNPLLPGLAGLEYGNTISGAEKVAEWAPGARVVKVFNTTGFNVMADPSFPGGPPAMLYCGDDAEAKAAAHQLAEEAGFEALDAGPLAQARLLEPYALLWITLAMKYGYGREIAFRLLRR